MYSRLFQLLAFGTAVLASPLELVKRSDAPYDVPAAALGAALNCPNGIKYNKPILLVHGTGSSASESWGGSPYLKLLPSLGYDVCTVNLPGNSLGDAQTSAEYVAYNIPNLSRQANGAKVSVIGHSQGNLNIQWALRFWPSTTSYVQHFFSLAGDFHGTGEGILACTATLILEGGCFPSLWQQTVGSHFLAALNLHGNTELVDTYSIYTRYDDVIQPELPPSPTSVLPNAALNIAIQDLCGPGHYADHFLMLIDAPSYYIITQVLANGSWNPFKFNYASCLEAFGPPGLLNGQTFVQDLSAIVTDIVRSATTGVVKSEPALKPYAANQ